MVLKQVLDKFCLGVCCLTPLYELIISFPVKQSSSRTAAPFSEYHYSSLWKVMRLMKMVMTCFHPPPQCLLGSKELQSLTNYINTYPREEQLFSFLLPPHCATLGVQHSHCYVPTLQFSVSFWPVVLSSKGCFLLFISFLGKHISWCPTSEEARRAVASPFHDESRHVIDIESKLQFSKAWSCGLCALGQQDTSWPYFQSLWDTAAH